MLLEPKRGVLNGYIQICDANGIRWKELLPFRSGRKFEVRKIAEILIENT